LYYLEKEHSEYQNQLRKLEAEERQLEDQKMKKMRSCRLKRSPFDLGDIVKTVTRPVISAAKTVTRPVISATKTVTRPVISAGKEISKLPNTVIPAINEISKMPDNIPGPLRDMVRTLNCPGQWLTAKVVNEIADIVDTLNGVKEKLRLHRYLISNKQEAIKETSRNIAETAKKVYSTEVEYEQSTRDLKTLTGLTETYIRDLECLLSLESNLAKLLQQKSELFTTSEVQRDAMEDQIKLSGIVKVMKELMAAFGEKIDLYTLDDSVTLADASRTLQQMTFQAAAVNTQLSEFFNLDVGCTHGRCRDNERCENDDDAPDGYICKRGCNIYNDCRPEDICVDDPSRPLGYKCQGWTGEQNGCIVDRNDKVEAAFSLDVCKELCKDEKSFKCVSVDYNPSRKTCHLSRWNSYSATSHFSTPCYLSGWKYVEFDQFPGWTTPAKNACIRRNNNKATTAHSLESCMKLCENERSFKCKSIDYKPGPGSCYLSEKNSRSAGSDFTMPCYLSGWLYAEIGHFIWKA